MIRSSVVLYWFMINLVYLLAYDSEGFRINSFVASFLSIAIAQCLLLISDSFWKDICKHGKDSFLKSRVSEATGFVLDVLGGFFAVVSMVALLDAYGL